MTQDEITALLARILPGGLGQLQQQPGAPVLNGWPDHTAGGLTGRFTPAVFRGPAPEPTTLAFRPGMDDPEVIMAAVRGQGGAPGEPPAPAGGPMPGLSRNPYDVQRTPRPSLAGYGPLQGAEPSSGAFSPLPQAADQMASMPPEQASGEMFGKIPMPPEFAGQTIGLGPDGFYSSGGAPTGSAVATNDAPQSAPRRSFLPDDFRNRVEDMLMGWAAGADGGVQGSLAMGGKMMAAGKLSRKEKADLAKSGNKTLEWAISKGMDPAEAQAVMEGVGPKGLIEYVQEASKGQKVDAVVVGDRLVDRNTGNLIADYSSGEGAAEGYELIPAEEAQRLGLDPSRPYQRNLKNGKIEPIGSSGQTIQVGSKLTETQSKDLGFVGRGMSAFQNAAELFPVLASPQSYIKNAPGGNYLLSPEYQMADQAGRELLAVILRKDTGAAITDQEMENYGRIYLPQPGDTPDVIQRKLTQAKGAIDSIYRGLGSIGQEYFPDYQIGLPQMPAAPGGAPNSNDPLGIR